MPRLSFALTLALILAGACARDSASTIEATGTIEGTEVDIAAMTPARVVTVRVREGDTVRVGDTLATLTQSALIPDIDRQRARLANAEAALRDLEAGARPAELDRADAELAAADAEADRSAKDLERAESLAKGSNISEQQLDQARAAARGAASRRAAARESLRLLREGPRPDRVQAARAEVGSARAALHMSEATASDLVLVAPVRGVIAIRAAEPGEVLGAGVPALTIESVAEPWVRVYIGERDIPRVRLGQRAELRLDGFPTIGFAGRVVAINDHAEYTPRVALTEEERADLVFGVKVAIEDSTHAIRAGVPAVVRIFTGAPAGAAATSGAANRVAPYAGRSP